MAAKQREDEPESGTTRTTLTLGNDALRLLRKEAEVSGHSMGEVVTDLILRSVENDQPERRVVNGILLLPERGKGRRVTMEQVNELWNELL